VDDGPAMPVWARGLCLLRNVRTISGTNTGVAGVLPWVERSGREVNHSPPSSAEVKNEWNCRPTPAPPIYLHSIGRDSVQKVLSSSLLPRYIRTKIYRNIILPVVLYGCGTWSLSMREEGRLKVFENWLLREIFGPKREEVTGKWRRLPNEEHNELYSSPNIIRVVKSRRMRWAGH